MIKLYDFKSSPNCQRVKVVLAEKNLPHEIVPIDLRKQEQKTTEYLKMNPYGKVPVLTDDATVLYESCIINEYLEEKYPNPPLLPKDPGKKAKARILIDYGMAHFDNPYQKLRMELTKDPKAKDILVNCMCPGWVKSDMGGPYATRSLAQGADTAVWLATLPKGGPTGGFYRDRKILPW